VHDLGDSDLLDLLILMEQEWLDQCQCLTQVLVPVNIEDQVSHILIEAESGLGVLIDLEDVLGYYQG
jgi:hypothetical protein